MNDTMDAAREARERIREWEDSLIRLVCPVNADHWVEVPAGAEAWCGRDSGRKMKVIR
jgi:hypothetical protein